MTDPRPGPRPGGMPFVSAQRPHPFGHEILGEGTVCKGPAAHTDDAPLETVPDQLLMFIQSGNEKAVPRSRTAAELGVCSLAGI